MGKRKREATTLEGLYHSDDQVFRFFRDGTFLDCIVRRCTDDSGDLIRSWLTRGHASVLEGVYQRRGNKISFSTPGHFGDGRLVEYEGTVAADELVLDSLNHNNGRHLRAERFKRF